MNKNIIFLVGMISIPIIGMDEPQEDKRCLWPPCDLIPRMLEVFYNDHYSDAAFIESIKFDKYCSTLACVNKELSEDVPYQFVRLTWERYFDSPLFLIIDRRLYNESRKDQCLMIAKSLLQNKFDPNYQRHCTVITPLQAAAKQQDKELVKLFLECGGDPFKTTDHWIPQGPLLYLNAFHYATNAYNEGCQLNTQPSGWLNDMWDMWNEIQKEKAQKHTVNGVWLLQSGDRAEATDK